MDPQIISRMFEVYIFMVTTSWEIKNEIKEYIPMNDD